MTLVTASFLSTVLYLPRSYDARHSEFSNGKHWEDESVLGRRAYFKSLSEVPALNIDPVVGEDHGQFSCRIEYGKSPTTTVIFTLFIIGQCPLGQVKLP